ncbi:MAG: radical SAM protein [Armatimonadota bacterium]|nr:B12-binding domain-containing radical SAM protein [Armatimonadota bacterium]MDW8026607.1 radical SAM protein [Armatimonadota bacterium]
MHVHSTGERWLFRPRQSGRLRVALVYPNSYFVGMSNLGIHAVLRLTDDECAAICERAFVEVSSGDLSKPITTLESNRSISSFDVVAFSVSFEGDYPNIVHALLSSGITLRARERKPLEPFVIGGGAALTINPEPLADLFDAIVIGEAEVIMPQLLQALERAITARDRMQAWEELAQVQGVYVPQMMSYPPTIAFADTRYIEPAHSVILTSSTEFADTFLIEVARGCSFKCHYCAYGNRYHPARHFRYEQVLDLVRRYRKMFASVGLVSAVVSAHPEIERIAWAIVEDGLRLSISSVRADVLPEGLIAALSRSGSISMTIAPETGTERLRAAIGKPIKDEDIFRGAALAEKYGMRYIKLYFMFGLPNESDEDIIAIGELVRSLVMRFKRLHFTISACAFVPKRHTKFELLGMAAGSELERKRKLLVKSLKGIERVKLSVESIRMSQLQALFSIGDRRMLSVIEKAIADGNSFSAYRKAAVEILGCAFEEFISQRHPEMK